jgi:hypothetical protein
VKGKAFSSGSREENGSKQKRVKTKDESLIGSDSIRTDKALAEPTRLLLSP